MKFHPFVSIPISATFLLTSTAAVVAANDATSRLQNATQAFQYVVSDPTKRVPPSVLRYADGVVIIPGLVQAGLFFGGKRGAGVMVVRESSGQWSDPAFVTLTGGSFGLQFGAASSDVVLVFMDKASLARVLSSDFNVGGDVKGVGGPVSSTAVTVSDSATGVYTYARREGLFAGVSLEGAKLAFDQDKSTEFYNQPGVTPRQIFTYQVKPASPEAVAALKRALTQAER